MFKAVILLIMSVFGVIQTFIYRFSLGFAGANLPLMFINSVARNFLVIFSAIDLILSILIIVYKKKGMQDYIDNIFTTIIIVVNFICIVLSIF